MEKKKAFIVDCLYYGCIAILLYLFAKYLLGILIPFIVGFVVAVFIRKLSLKVFNKPGRTRLVPILFAFYILLGFIASILSVIIVNSFAKIDYAGLYSNFIEPAINIIYENVQQLNQTLPAKWASILNQATTGIFDTIKNVMFTISSFTINLIKNIVVSVPSTLISVIVTIVSSVYFAQDYDKIILFGKNVLPTKWVYIIENLVEFVKKVLSKIILSYIEIMGITCLELFIGFVILKISNPLLLATIISILDILPILGVGTVLIPWFIIAFAFGNVGTGIGLIILYLTITIIRNIIEPRLVGTNLGLTPLITLIGMMVGLGLFGVVGMFALPLSIAFVLYLWKKEDNNL